MFCIWYAIFHAPPAWALGLFPRVWRTEYQPSSSQSFLVLTRQTLDNVLIVERSDCGSELPVSSQPPNNSTTISTLQNMVLQILEESQCSSTVQFLASKVTAICQTRAALTHLARLLLFKDMLPDVDLLQFIPLGNVRSSLALSAITRSLPPFGAWGSWDGPVPFHHPDHTFSGMFLSENTTLTICCLVQGCCCLCWAKAFYTECREDLRRKVLWNI